MSTKTVEIWGAHTLSHDEIDKRKEQIGEVIEHKAQLERKVKELSDQTKDYKKTIESEEARIKRYSDAIRTGSEEGYIDCDVVFRPAKGVKDYVDVTNGEVIKTVEMTEEDHQLKANFGNE